MLNLNNNKLKGLEKKFDNEEYSGVVLELNRFLKLHPKDAEGYYLLFRTYNMLGDVNSAISSLKKAYSLNPKHPEIKEQMEILHDSGNPTNKSDVILLIFSLLILTVIPRPLFGVLHHPGL